MKSNKQFVRYALFLFPALALVAVLMLVIKIHEHRAHVWLPSHISRQVSVFFHPEHALQDPDHLMFLFVDHHEHLTDGSALESSQQWNTRFRNEFSELRDDYGNQFKYTWFYPIDHHNDDVLLELNRLVFDGFGEIEVHWHHGPDTSKSFNTSLRKELVWFQSFGALAPIGEAMEPQFGFIHGNWTLDNSGDPKHCGVNNELEILQKAGAYADFTFPAPREDSQPRKISSIYYAIDGPESKSYDWRVNVTTGTVGNGFMIFQGPTGIDFKTRAFEYGGWENWLGSGKHRIPLWIKYAPYVHGRPSWRFVKKLYTWRCLTGKIIRWPDKKYA